MVKMLSGQKDDWVNNEIFSKEKSKLFKCNITLISKHFNLIFIKYRTITIVKLKLFIYCGGGRSKPATGSCTWAQGSCTSAVSILFSWHIIN